MAAQLGLHPAHDVGISVRVVVDGRALEGRVEPFYQGPDETRTRLGENELEAGKVVEQAAGHQRHQAHLPLLRREEVEAVLLEVGQVADAVAVLDVVEEDGHLHLLGPREERPQLLVAAEAVAVGMVLHRVDLVQHHCAEPLLLRPLHLADGRGDVLELDDGHADEAVVALHHAQVGQVVGSGDGGGKSRLDHVGPPAGELRQHELPVHA